MKPSFSSLNTNLLGLDPAYIHYIQTPIDFSRNYKQITAEGLICRIKFYGPYSCPLFIPPCAAELASWAFPLPGILRGCNSPGAPQTRWFPGDMSGVGEGMG